jgi:hypothetical protein
MTSTEAFEAKLSRGSDSTVLRGKLVVVANAPVVPTAVLALNPASLGVRCVAAATIFSRYRFKYIRFKFLTGTSSATGITNYACVGVQDDIGLTANTPTGAAGVLELRCSGSSFNNQTVPTQFEWTPVDKNLWYYTTNDLTDARLSTSGILYSAGLNAATSTMDMEIDYCIVFQGATDIGAL